jgi:L-alanine-DL-glutamate epimerase-like enolase superfamily enzyme
MMGPSRSSRDLAPRKLEVRTERWPLHAPIRITGRTFVEAAVICVSVRDGEMEGRGEAAGVYYFAQTTDSMAREIRRVASDLVHPKFGRADLQALLPPGGSRNALDCALWELDARHGGCAVWQLAGLPRPRPLVTTVTLGADEPASIFEAVSQIPWARRIKLKLIGDDADLERVRAARRARPDVWLGVDANQAFTAREFVRLLPSFLEARVELIEQPLAADQDDALRGIRSPIPLVADESVQCARDLARTVGKYQMINIKLDKCGGLTEALSMAHLARKLGLGLMVGNMGGTSLAMSPACLVGQLCDVVDLDGPLLLAGDRTPAVSYQRGEIAGSEQVWG